MDIFSKYNITRETYEQKEKKALEHIVKIYVDINETIMVLEKQDRGKFMLGSLALTFVLADTMSRFYELMEFGEHKLGLIYRVLGLNNKNRFKRINNQRRFKKWIKAFVLTDENKIYRARKNDINCNAELIWRLRNSVIHFFGLPDFISKNSRIMLLNGSWQNDKRMQKMIEHFKKEGVNIKIIDINGLRDAIVDSNKVFMKYLINVLRGNQDKYLQGILLIHRITEREGTAIIDAGDRFVNG